LITNPKRKKTRKPNYNSVSGDTGGLTFVKSPVPPVSSYNNQTEDLRDFHYDYLWKVG